MRRPALILVLALAAVPGLAFAVEAAPDERGWLGVFLDNAGPDPAADGDDLRAAVVVRGVVQEGPAAEAGLRARDRIVAVDGAVVSSLDELIAQIGDTAPGSWVPMTVERRGSERVIRVRLGTRPERTQGLRVRRGWIGVEGIDLTPALRQHFGAPEDAGVMVSAIVEGGPAEAAGLDLGDVIYDIDGMPVVSASDLKRFLAVAGVENEIELTLMRNGTEIVLEAVVEEEPEKER